MKHPSGRPIRRAQRRDYSLKAVRTTEFRCPRLNIPKANTYAMGFVDHRDSYAEDVPMECRSRTLLPKS